jgi:carboxyl-terminal processing protease
MLSFISPIETTQQSASKDKPSLLESLIKNTSLKRQGENAKAAYNPEKDIYPGLRMIAEVTDLIEQRSFRLVNFRKFIEEALKNALPYCDAHSAFFTPKSFTETKETTSGKFSGIGVSIISKAPSDDDILITDVIDGGPSQKAGLKPGDKIVEIEGVKLRGLSSDEVVTKLRGQIKTKITVKVIRKKEPLEFTITRDIIKNEVAVAYHFESPDVYYLSLRLFTENAAVGVTEILEKANKNECKGIVLDLRRNPGGILESAVDMAGLFVDKGSVIVSTKNREQKIMGEYKTTKNPVFKSDIPVFLLIDNFSASASEILSGCLKYYSNQPANKNGRNLMIFLLGTQTFGKGSVQEVIPISNGCALKLTTMLYYLPDGSSIQAGGVEPDFTVKPRSIPEEELKWIDEFSGRETSLRYHITKDEVDNPKKGQKYDESHASRKTKNKEDDKGDPESWEKKRIKALGQDSQLQAAINMISMLNVTRSLAPESVNTREKAVAFLKKNYVTDDLTEIKKVK